MSTRTQPPPPTDPRTAAEWIEFSYAQGWSDGLPLVPPKESVQAMLAAGGLTADEILGTIDERNAILPAEKIAINACLARARAKRAFQLSPLRGEQAASQQRAGSTKK